MLISEFRGKPAGHPEKYCEKSVIKLSIVPKMVVGGGGGGPRPLPPPEIEATLSPLSSPTCHGGVRQDDRERAGAGVLDSHELL